MHAEFGAWYARFNFNGRHVHKPWVRYQRDMYELFTKRLAVHPSPVLWRSYGPSHFGGMTGTYTGTAARHIKLSWVLPVPFQCHNWTELAQT